MKLFSKAAAMLMLLAATSCTTTVKEDTSVKWNTPGAGNPLLPGYFADPTIKKFGDTYYIYATTDGTGNGYGPAQVWMSKDFVNCLLGHTYTSFLYIKKFRIHLRFHSLFLMPDRFFLLGTL